MPVTAIVGANWGDEGKGKMTDCLAADSDLVVRFQGGNNAGQVLFLVETVQAPFVPQADRTWGCRFNSV